MTRPASIIMLLQCGARLRLVFLPASILAVPTRDLTGHLLFNPVPQLCLARFPSYLLHDCMEHEGPAGYRGPRNAKRLDA